MPAEQGSAAAAPSGQYLPASHGSHAVAPAAPWNFPAAHGAQDGLPVPAAYVPAAHGCRPSVDVAPVVQKWPASHGVQSSLCRSVASE